MASCVFDANDGVNFPFVYRDANGSTITNGTLVSVPGFATPVCTFPTAACSLGSNPTFPNNGSTFECCQSTPATSGGSQVWYVPMIAFWGLYFAAIFGICVAKRRAKKQGKTGRTTIQKGMGAFNMGMDKMSCVPKVALLVTFLLAIVALIAEAQIMPTSIQKTLSPTDGAARLAMSAFLTPVQEVFSFLEDAMVVKVGYALAANRLTELNMLLHVGVIGGLVCGIAAFLLLLALASSDASAEALLNPSSASNQQLIASGCGLVATSTELLAHARVYWVLSASTWPITFATASMRGFLAGVGNFVAYLLPMFIQATVPIALWFGLLPLAESQGPGASKLTPLSLLGIAQAAGPWLVGLIFVLLVVCNGKLRRQYRLHCLCCSRRGGSSSGGGLGELCSVLKEVATEGLELMIVDLAVQLSLTITIYVAALHNFETAYKIAAAQSAYWVFGPSYLMGIMLFLKVSGSQVIASGNGDKFALGFKFVMILVSVMSVAALVAALWKRVYVAHSYGETACMFAAESGCASAYAAIFQGSDSLKSVFSAFGPTVALNMFFLALRTGLATCHDFGFMAKASVVVLVVVYVPVMVLVSLFAHNIATAYYVAMYCPHFAMIIVFGARMYKHVGALKAGKPGPWASHLRRGSVVSQSDGLLVPNAGGRGGGEVEVDGHRAMGQHTDYVDMGS